MVRLATSRANVGVSCTAFGRWDGMSYVVRFPLFLSFTMPAENVLRFLPC